MPSLIFVVGIRLAPPSIIFLAGILKISSPVLPAYLEIISLNLSPLAGFAKDIILFSGTLAKSLSISILVLPFS
jgi:hypothetical protein